MIQSGIPQNLSVLRFTFCDYMIFFLGNVVSTHEKKTVSQARQTSLVSSRAQVRPFAGKVFYLDLPSNRAAETLETDIKELGGVKHANLT